MKKFQHLRFATYALLLGAVFLAGASKRHFIEVSFEDRIEVPAADASPDEWMLAFSQRTSAFNHFEAEHVARQWLLQHGVPEKKLFGSIAILQRGATRGTYVVVFPEEIKVNARRLVAITVAENRVAVPSFSIDEEPIRPLQPTPGS